MNNQEICQKLRRLHTLLTLGKRSNNLALTIRRALDFIPTWQEDVDTLLQRTPIYVVFGGYGPKFIKIFQELITTGHIALLDKLQSEYDPFFCYLCELPSIGETMARRMFFERSIHTMDDLRIAYCNHILQLIPSFGETRLRVIEEVLMQNPGNPITTAPMTNDIPSIPSIHPAIELPKPPKVPIAWESIQNTAPLQETPARDISREISSFLETHPNDDIDENLSNEIADFVSKDLAEAYRADVSTPQISSHASMSLSVQPRIVDRQSSTPTTQLTHKKPNSIKEIRDFKRLRDSHGYYLDKTHLLIDLIENGGLITHFHRPVRFGKTLALSMIKTFFERECCPAKPQINNAKYFEGLRVMQASQTVLNHLGQYPVVSISTMPIDASGCAKMISMLYRQWRWLLDNSRLDEYDRKQFNIYLNRSVKLDTQELMLALRFLIDLIHETTGRRVVLLVDTYLDSRTIIDLENDVLSELISCTVTNNDGLERAVIMSDDDWPWISNADNITVHSRIRDEYFGFSELEVRNILRDFHLDDEYRFVKSWYGGVDVSGRDVFIPEGVLKFVQSMQTPGATVHNVLQWHERFDDKLAQWQMLSSGSFSRYDIATLIANHGSNRSLPCELIINRQAKRDTWIGLINQGLVKAIEQIPTNHGTIQCKIVLPNRYAQYIFCGGLESWYFVFWDKYFNDAEHQETLMDAIKLGPTEAIAFELCKLYAELPAYGDVSSYCRQMGNILSHLPFVRILHHEDANGQHADIITIDKDGRTTVFGIELVSETMLEENQLSHLITQWNDAEAADLHHLDDIISACADHARSRLEDESYAERLKTKYVDIADIQYYGIGFYRNRLSVK